MFIQRDYSRTINDDWVLNIQPKLGEFMEAVEIYHEGAVVSWKIQNAYE